jgi:hypothetical protein
MDIDWDKTIRSGEKLKATMRRFGDTERTFFIKARQKGMTLFSKRVAELYNEYFKRQEFALRTILMCYGFNPDELTDEDKRQISERGQWIISPEDHLIGRKVFYFDKIPYIESVTHNGEFRLTWLACPLIGTVATDCPK